MLDFLDLVLVSGCIWLPIAAMLMFIGYLVGQNDSPINWIEGYEAGRKAVMEQYDLEIYEREGGSLNV